VKDRKSLADMIFPPKIVVQFSAVMDGFNVKKLSIHRNHIDMCKFENSDEVGYTRIAQQIRILFSEAISGESPAAS
jgi:hypothetical protein